MIDRPNRESHAVTSLLRFLLTIAVLAGLVYAGMVALALFVEPQQREMTVTVPAGRLGK